MVPPKNTPPAAAVEAPWPPTFALHPDGEPRRKGALAQLPRRPLAEKWRPAEPVFHTSCWSCTSRHCAFNTEMSRRQVNIVTTLSAFVAMVQEGRATDQDFTAAAKLWDADELAAALDSR